MANSILSSPFTKAITTFINEKASVPCWTDAKVVTVDIVSDSDNSSNPLSTEHINESSVYSGLISSDIKTAKILRPVRVRVSFLTDNLSLIENVLSLFYDITTTIKVTSKSIVAPSMTISNVEIEQTPDMLSAAKLVLTLEQVVLAQELAGWNPEQPGDQSTYGINVKTPVVVGPSLLPIGSQITNVLTSASDAVTTLYNQFANSIGL